METMSFASPTAQAADDDEVFQVLDVNITGFPSSTVPEVVGVALSPVIIHFLLLIAVVCFGVPANAIVLLAARWPTRSRHVWRRLVIGNLCLAQLFVSVIVSPVGLVTVLFGYLQRPLPAGLCTSASALMHAALAASVIGFCLLTAIRWQELNLACSGEQQADEASGRSIVAMVVMAVAPWAAAATTAALTAVEFPASEARAVCRDLAISQVTPGASWRMKPILVLMYVLATAVCIAVLGAAYRCYGNRLDRLLVDRSEQTILLDGNASDVSSRATEQNRSRKSSRGQELRQSGKRGVVDGKRPTNLMVFDGRPNEGVEADEENEEAEAGGTVEDTFDTKMRLKFQKKPRSSGRRHTVANIGLPDLGNQRRRSLENGKGKSTSPANDYQYVRKWSVDITALANQLENPKIHTGSYPTLRNNSPSSTYLDPGCPVGGPARPLNPTQTAMGLALPGASSPSQGLPLTIPVDKKTSADQCITLETPSIVVSLTPDTEAGDDNTLDDSFESRSRLESDETASHSVAAAAAAYKKSRILSKDVAPDDKRILTAKQELSEVLSTAIGMLVSLLLMLPSAVFAQAARAFSTRYGLNAAFNVDLICAALCLFQAATIPAFQVWANRELKDQLALIKALLKSLRCVCYCNLGPGQSCNLVKKRKQKKRQQKV